MLGNSNIGSILDFSVEGKENENDFEVCMNETIKTIHKATNNANIPFCVFKVTGLASFELLEKVSSKTDLNTNEKKEFEHIYSRVDTICKTAYEAGVCIFMDAEESWIQDAIDNLANTMMTRYNKQKPIVYTTFQLYRTDRFQYLKQALQLANKENYFLGAKLVRGAYMEKERERALENNYPSPIHEYKSNTDTDYNNALLFCVENIHKIAFCAASHNEKSTLYLVELMEEKKIQKNNVHVFFAQLLGMSDHISYNLSNAGYNVAKYVPYGPIKEVVPYLIRRAQENTFVNGQTGRELGLIIKEKERRKKNYDGVKDLTDTHRCPFLNSNQ